MSEQTKEVLNQRLTTDFPIDCVKAITELTVAGDLGWEIAAHASYVAAWITAFQAGALGNSSTNQADLQQVYEVCSECIETLTGNSPERSGIITDFLMSELFKQMLSMLIKIITDRISK